MSLLLLLDISVSSGPTSPSNAQILPLLSVAFGGISGDLSVQLTFLLANGSPLSLAGISFQGSIFNAVETIATLSSTGGSPMVTVTGTGLNVLSIIVPAAQVAGWAPGQYAMEMVASDGTYSSDLFGNALVVVGSSIPSTASVTGQRGVAILV
jgi:hypothetical protein